MEPFLPVIRMCPLFAGVADGEILAMLACLDARRKRYQKDSFLLSVGDRVHALGLVLEGTLLVIQEDIWGNRNIVRAVGAGETFAASYACADVPLSVSVCAESCAEILFLDMKRILNVCSASCSHHGRIIHNLLCEVAEKNLLLSEKLSHLGQRSTRAKLMSYFSAMARKAGRYEFDIPFTRQQLADFLAVERSGLSVELGKMKNEGLLEFDKNHFIVKV